MGNRFSGLLSSRTGSGYVAATAAFFAAMVVLSSRKPMSFDEMFTYRIAQLPSVAAIWTGMADGLGETNPPFMHTVAHFTLLLPLPPELAIRLPSMLGYWAMVTCVLSFVARRVSPLSAAVATAVLSCQFSYAIQGRAYGVVLGLSGIAFLLWQSATESARPVWQSIALGLCLATATFAHFYGFLLILPLALAELVRYRGGSRVSVPILGSLLVGLLPMAALLPFARYSRTWSATFWGQPHPGSALSAYNALCGEPLSLVIANAAAWMAASFLRKADARRQAGFSRPDAAIIAACLLMPVWVFLLSIYTRAYSPRYGIIMIPGAAMVTAWMLQRVGQINEIMYYGAIIVIMNCVVYQVDRQATSLSRHGQVVEAMLNDIERELASDDRIACIITEHHRYMTIQSYLGPERNRRVYCLYNSAHPERYRTIRELSRITDLNLVDSADMPEEIARRENMILVRSDSVHRLH